jgi:hypothetical protein
MIWWLPVIGVLTFVFSIGFASGACFAEWAIRRRIRIDNDNDWTLRCRFENGSMVVRPRHPSPGSGPVRGVAVYPQRMVIYPQRQPTSPGPEG